MKSSPVEFLRVQQVVLLMKEFSFIGKMICFSFTGCSWRSLDLVTESEGAVNINSTIDIISYKTAQMSSTLIAGARC